MLHPTKLTLVRTFKQKQMKLPGDIVDVLISGMSAEEEDLLLFCDYSNGRVKSVSRSTRAVNCIFAEPDDEWKLCCCVLVNRAEGHFLIVLEVRKNKDRKRITISRDGDSAGKFHHIQNIPLPGQPGLMVCMHFGWHTRFLN